MRRDRIEPDTTCPHWCAADHSLYAGEEAHVHVGIDERLTGAFTVRLVASHHPDTGEMDGPYLLVDAPNLALDTCELSLAQARDIGAALIDLADSGAQHTEDAVMLTFPGQQRPVKPPA